MRTLEASPCRAGDDMIRDGTEKGSSKEKGRELFHAHIAVLQRADLIKKEGR